MYIQSSHGRSVPVIGVGGGVGGGDDGQVGGGVVGGVVNSNFRIHSPISGINSKPFIKEDGRECIFNQ